MVYSFDIYWREKFSVSVPYSLAQFDEIRYNDVFGFWGKELSELVLSLVVDLG